MEITGDTGSVLRRRTVQDPKTPNDSCSDDGHSQHQNAEQFHHGEHGRRTCTETRRAQPQSGAANDEVEKHDSGNDDYNDEHRHKRTKQNPHKCHVEKATSRSIIAEAPHRVYGASQSC